MEGAMSCRDMSHDAHAVDITTAGRFADQHRNQHMDASDSPFSPATQPRIC